jgi:hypothetical protein
MRVLKKGVGSDHERIRPLTRKACEGGIDFACRARLQNLDFERQRRGGRLGPIGIGAHHRRIVRVLQERHGRGVRQQLTQQFEPLGGELDVERRDAGDVAAGPGQACHDSGFDRINRGHEDDRDR